MQLLTEQEIDLVFGGAEAPKPPEGKGSGPASTPPPPPPPPYTQCMIDSVGWSQGKAEWAGVYCAIKVAYDRFWAGTSDK